MKVLKLLNSTKINGKEYTINDVRGFKPISSYGLPEGFYGGRVDKVAGTDDKGIYLCIEGMKVIDILADEAQEEIPFEDEGLNYEEMTNKELIAILEDFYVEVPKKANKAELIELIHKNK